MRVMNWTWFENIGWLDILDIALVLVLMYEGYKLVKGTGANKVFAGLIAIVVLWRVVEYFDMQLTASLLGSIVNVGIVAIFIVFQPEIRRFLLLLGSRSLIERSKKEFRFLSFLFKETTASTLNIDAIVAACDRMSKSLTGALIVLAKENELDYPISTGERIDARISTALIENIFYKNSPLHDGAIIVKHNKIIAARCILPVSANPQISPTLGLRHRSAFGMTEQTDAIALVVSEQTGAISFVKTGTIERNISLERLNDLLTTEFEKENPARK